MRLSVDYYVEECIGCREYVFNDALTMICSGAGNLAAAGSSRSLWFRRLCCLEDLELSLEEADALVDDDVEDSDCCWATVAGVRVIL